jgi:hypothetical protein
MRHLLNVGISLHGLHQKSNIAPEKVALRLDFCQSIVTATGINSPEKIP